MRWGQHWEPRPTIYESYEQEERARSQYRDMYDNFKNNLSQFIEMEGLDPKDKRIDWGDESEPLMSKQRGAVFAVGRVIYYSFWLEGGSRSLAGISDTGPNPMDNPVVAQMVKRYGRMLASIPFKVGEDTSGIE